MPIPSLLLILGVLLVFQTTIMNYCAVFGIKPDLVMLFVVLNGFLLGPREGAFLGFFGGLIEDFFVGSYLGLNGLTLLTAGFVAGICGERFYKENSLIVMAVTFFSASVSWLINYILLRYLAIDVAFFPAITQIILPTALYTSVLVPLFYKRVLRAVIIKNKEL